MNYSHEVENMCIVAKGPQHGPAPIPEEAKWVKAYEMVQQDGELFAALQAALTNNGLVLDFSLEKIKRKQKTINKI